jgi:hypothetical protein
VTVQMLRRMWVAATASVLVTMGVVTAAGAAASALPIPPPGAPDNRGALDWGRNSSGQLGDATLAQ